MDFNIKVSTVEPIDTGRLSAVVHSLCADPNVTDVLVTGELSDPPAVDGGE